jgi:hypothetical protein
MRLPNVAQVTCKPTATTTYCGHYTFNRKGGVLRFHGHKFFEDRDHFERCLVAWNKSNDWHYEARLMPVMSIGQDEIDYALQSEAA